jgi:hypothetical protein
MKRIFLLAVVITLMAFSCEKEENCMPFGSNTCAVNNPIEELEWLKAEIERREQNTSDIDKYFYIQQAEYNRQTIFIFNNCCPMCNTMVPAYNCKGKLLFYLGDKPEESKKIKNTKVIWKPQNYACSQN